MLRVADDEDEVGYASGLEGGRCCGGGDIINGLCLMTGLVLAGRPGELWGLGGCVGLVVGAGLTGGLWDLVTGSALITLVPPLRS